MTYRWFSPDVIVAMLVHRTDEEKMFWEFYSIIMQNMSHNLLLFCAPTWPSYHVIENQLFELFMRRVYLNYLFVSKGKPNNYKFAFRHTVHQQFI